MATRYFKRSAAAALLAIVLLAASFAPLYYSRNNVQDLRLFNRANAEHVREWPGQSSNSPVAAGGTRSSQAPSLDTAFNNTRKDPGVEQITPRQVASGQAGHPASPVFLPSEEEWAKAGTKGRWFMCSLDDPRTAGDLASSKWQDYSALKEWGWEAVSWTDALVNPYPEGSGVGRDTIGKSRAIPMDITHSFDRTESKGERGILNYPVRTLTRSTST